MKCGAGNFQLQLPPNVRLQGLLRGKTWQSHVFPLNNPFGPSSLMPQSEINPPAHMHGIKIKENLNYTVLKHFPPLSIQIFLSGQNFQISWALEVLIDH